MCRTLLILIPILLLTACSRLPAEPPAEQITVATGI